MGKVGKEGGGGLLIIFSFQKTKNIWSSSAKFEDYHIYNDRIDSS